LVTFRRTEPSDTVTIAGWIARDPDHRGVDPSFFVGSGTAPGAFSCYTIEDDEGPVIFVRQESDGEDTRLHTQFPPVSGKRVVRALSDAYPSVAEEARKRGFKRIRWESGSIALVRFMLSKFTLRAELYHDL
jgi:hypothetical protein